MLAWTMRRVGLNLWVLGLYSMAPLTIIAGVFAQSWWAILLGISVYGIAIYETWIAQKPDEDA